MGLDGSPWAGRRGSGSFRRPVCGRQGHGARPAVGPEGAAARGGHRGRGALQMAGTAACGVSQAHSWVGSRPLRPSGHTARPRAGSLVKWGRKPALMKMAEQRVEDLWGSPLSASGPQLHQRNFFSFFFFLFNFFLKESELRPRTNLTMSSDRGQPLRLELE